LIGLTYTQIVEKIQKEKGLSLNEIEAKVKTKLRELSDLISKEGAAYIVANELGVKMFEDFGKRTLKINQLISGIGSLNLVGKVVDIYEVREFDKNNRKGKVASLLIGDETGTCRVVLWDTNHIKEVENGNRLEDICVLFRTHQQGRVIKRLLDLNNISYFSVTRSSSP